MDQDDVELEFSPLCREVTRDDVTVSVQIYRMAGAENRWSLEVVDEDNTSTVWDETFEKDTDAYEEFIRTLNREGILTFTQDEPTGTRH
jgi:hypothetical protein